MRRRGRIKEILKVIESKWNEYPDQRLGQLLQNYFDYGRGDIFYKEDDRFGVKVFDERTGWMTKKQYKETRKLFKDLNKRFPCKEVK